MQMVWVYGQLIPNVASSLGPSPLSPPVEWFHAYQRELLRQTATIFNAKAIYITLPDGATA